MRQNNLFSFFAIFVLVAGVIGYIPDKRLGLYLSKNLVLEWAVILFIAMFFLKNWWLKGFLVWSLIATIHNYNKWSFLVLHTIVLMMVFYQILCDNLNHKNSVYLLNVICVLALLQTTLMILQYYDIWFLFRPKTIGTRPLVGFLANPNHAGAFLALSLPAFFRRKWIWLIPIVLLGLVMADSTGAMIAATIGTMAFVWFIVPSKRWLFVPLVLLAGAGVIWKYDLSAIFSINARFQAWKGILTDYIPLKWFMGWGLGQFKVSFPKIYQLFISGYPSTTSRWEYAHNEFIQLWAEWGIIGLGMVLGYLGHQCIKFIQNRKTLIGLIVFSGVVIAVVNANVNFLFHLSICIVPIIYLAVLNTEVSYGINQT